MEWRKALVGVGQLGRGDIEEIFRVADGIVAEDKAGALKPALAGKVLANLFYEPSTRTSSSFHAAMSRQGGSVISINDVNYSSVSKGENLADTVRTLASYADIIALRHSANDATASVCGICPVPIINAGNGTGEHPTQALLDLYTIRQEAGRLEGLTVTLMGDLKHGRTVHSLVELLRPHEVKLVLVAPEGLGLPDELLRPEDRVVEDVAEVLADSDVMYVTRVQKERLPEAMAGRAFHYRIGLEEMAQARPGMVLMHPLPRNAEIDPAVDGDKRAAYFRQMKYGLWVRMALLRMMAA